MKLQSLGSLQRALNQPEQTKDISEIMIDMVDKFTLDDAFRRIGQELQKPEFFEEIQKIIAKSFYNKFIEYSDCNDDIYNKSEIWNVSMISAKNILDILCNQNMKKQ